MSIAEKHVFFTDQSAPLLTSLLKKHRAKNLFIVTDQTAFTASGAREKYLPIFKKYNHIFFDDFSTNPKLSDVQRGTKLFRCHLTDTTIAIGGGSSIDMAKLISLLAPETKPYKELITGSHKFQGRKSTLLTIPTTAGSGSEATHFAAVYLQSNKYSVAHPSLLPDAAIIDATLTLSCPPYLTAVTGVDALSQAIESYWSINSTPQSKSYAANALNLILAHLVPATRNGTKKDRLALAKAAHLSGQAINITKTTAPHALSYTLTIKYGIPHGQAVAVFLPWFIVYNSNISEQNVSDPRGTAYVRKTINEVNKLLSA
jgi:alcohol dehydrogenase class IV